MPCLYSMALSKVCRVEQSMACMMCVGQDLPESASYSAFGWRVCMQVLCDITSTQ